MSKVLMKGNEFIAEAAIQAGCDLFFGYPITPSTEIVEYLSKHLPKAGGAVLQAECEVGAINMCYGAAATGKRVMTASSGLGISLKQEGLSQAAAAELPIVVVNISRSGPGLGGLGASQADYFQSTKGGGHGDYRLIVLAPSRAQEMYDYTMEAFDLAQKYRNPVMILAEGFLGQMMEPAEIKKRPPVQKLDESWIVGNRQGRAKRQVASYGLTNEDCEANCLHWEEKYNQIRENLQRWDSFQMEDAEYLLVGYGTCGRIGKSVVQMARKQGIKLGLIRPITLWPFPEQAFIPLRGKLKGVLTVELSTGQMVEDVNLSLQCSVPSYFYGRQGGILPSDNEIFRHLLKTFQLPGAEGV